MLTKTTIALALILATTSGALAAPKKHNNNNTNATQSQTVYDTRGWYVGSDPDPTVRAQLARDPVQ
jgi:hypothetical protein